MNENSCILGRYAVSADVNGYRRLHNQGQLHQSTRCHIPETLNRNQHSCEKLKARTFKVQDGRDLRVGYVPGPE